MKRTHSILLLLLSCLLSLSSCKKDRLNVPVVEQSTPTKANIHDIIVIDENISYAVGGIRWEHGEWLQTYDGGTTWISDTISSHELNNLSYTDDGHSYLVGFKSKYRHSILSILANIESATLSS